MTRYIISILFLCLTTVAFSQQSMDQLFKTAAKQPKATHIKINQFVMILADIFTNTMGVNSIEIIELDGCSTKVKNYILDAINNTKDPLFEKFVSANEEDSQTRILIHIKKKWIKEIVVIEKNNKEESINLIRIRGKIKPEEWKKAIKN